MTPFDLILHFSLILTAVHLCAKFKVSSFNRSWDIRGGAKFQRTPENRLFPLTWRVIFTTARALELYRALLWCDRKRPMDTGQTAASAHRRRSGWYSGDAWWAPKVGGCRVGLGMGSAVPSDSRLGASWAPQLPQLPSSPETWFLRILKATERSFLYLYDKI